MAKIKTSTLTGEKLAEWTALAQRWRIVEFPEDNEDERYVWFDSSDVAMYPVKDCVRSDGYRPDINAGQAMELAKKFGLVVYFAINSVSDGRGGKLYQNNAIEIAICHAVVASVFGEEVDDGNSW